MNSTCLIALSLFCLAGCSSAPKELPKTGECVARRADDRQVISIATEPSNAKCTLTNDQGSWVIAATPGAVSIKRAPSPLTVTCQAPGYYAKAQNILPELRNQGVFDMIGSAFTSTKQTISNDAYHYPALQTILLTATSLPENPLVPPEKAGAINAGSR